jgi:hypothetical protein
VGKQIKRAMKETSIYNPMEELNALTVQMENAIRDNDLAYDRAIQKTGGCIGETYGGGCIGDKPCRPSQLNRTEPSLKCGSLNK